MRFTDIENISGDGLKNSREMNSALQAKKAARSTIPGEKPKTRRDAQSGRLSVSRRAKISDAADSGQLVCRTFSAAAGSMAKCL